jgi:hypothetical protein
MEKFPTPKSVPAEEARRLNSEEIRKAQIGIEGYGESPTREELVAALKADRNDPNAREVFNRYADWKEKRERVSEYEDMKESIDLYLDAGLEGEAVSMCQEIIDEMGLPLAPDEPAENGLSSDGEELYRFCVSVCDGSYQASRTS